MLYYCCYMLLHDAHSKFPQRSMNFPYLLILSYIHYVTGNWRGQLDHIYAHLIDRCKNDIAFRNAICDPKMGQVRIDSGADIGAFVFKQKIKELRNNFSLGLLSVFASYVLAQGKFCSYGGTNFSFRISVATITHDLHHFYYVYPLTLALLAMCVVTLWSNRVVASRDILQDEDCATIFFLKIYLI